MKVRRKKRTVWTAWAAAALMSVTSAFPAGAVTLDWDELTSAQQEKAYNDLAAENQALKERIAELEEQLGLSAGQQGASENGTSGDGASGAGGSQEQTQQPQEQAGQEPSGQQAAEAAQEAQSSAVKSVDAFLADVAASFNARQELARTYTTDQISAMSEADMWDFRFRCAEEERSFYNTYAGAQFDDLNVLYLCSEYCTGLGKQYQAKDVWNGSQDSAEANRLYTAGYYNRAYALVELSEYYGLDLAEEYSNLKNAVVQMDALSGDETRNQGVDPATVTQVQELLNSIGFLCGAADGIPGRQTASCIERFQVMYGYEPADGVIDDELIGQLNQILARKQG